MTMFYEVESKSDTKIFFSREITIRGFIVI
jgi:hypothetical protein